MPNESSKRSELQAFAKRIEDQVIASKGVGAMERLICRHLTNGKKPVIASAMAAKWVEWRYGKATEHVKIDGHIEHTVFDTSKLSDEQLEEAERLVESAESRDVSSDSQ